MSERRNVKHGRESKTKTSPHSVCPMPWFPLDLVQSINQMEPRGMWGHQAAQHSNGEPVASRYLHQGVV